ncbi:MAG: pre-peptidase C-terminal domain-containing protein [Prevotella sp.]|nr:pre-peptidase C-terminal domain-containing protein [Prevotella sp.]
MKTKHLPTLPSAQSRWLATFALLLLPLWAVAQQYWESGTTKVNMFFNYSSGDNTYNKTQVSYLINPEQDGRVEFYAEPLGNVRITGIALHAVQGDELLPVASSGGTALAVDDVAAGVYQVTFTGQPTDRAGQGGNFLVGYAHTPAPYVNDPEPNDTWERAYQIESGNVQQGHLGYKRGSYTDTEDWFKIVVPDEGTVTFTTHASSRLRLSWLGMYTLNAEGNAVDYRNDKNMDAQGKDSTVIYTVPNVAPGTYHVRLRRYNGSGGYKLTYDFKANTYGADSPDNDTWQNAVDMALDTPTDGRLGYHFNGNTDTEDWMKIVVPEEGKITFTAKAETSLRLSWLGMYTLNADGTAVDYRNDKNMDAQGRDSTVVYEVPDVAIGTYYVRLRRYNGYGGYTLNAYFTSHADEADPEPNDTWQEAMPLKSGPAVTGQLGYTFNGNTDAVDWYKIVVPKEGSITFSTRTETTLRLSWLGMYTLNADGNAVDYRNDKNMDAQGKDSTVVYTVPDVAPGTYYVQLKRYNGYGTYSLQYVHNPNAHENDPEPNNEWAASTLIESGTIQQGCLGYHFNGNTDTEDWFRIELPDEGKVTFAATAETTLRLSWLGMYTLNAEGTAVDYRNDKNMDALGKDSTVVYTVPDCKPGTYYVRLRRYNGYGGYRLDYTFTPNTHGQDNLDNDTWQQGDIIETGITQQGRLGYRFNGDTDTEDWFRIELPYVGNITLSTHAEPTLRLSWLGLYIPNAEGSAVDYRTDKNMDAQGNDTTVTFSVSGLGAGTYYVRLRRYNGCGGYTLKYEYERNPWDRDNLQNGTFAQRFQLTEGETVATTLGYRYREQNNEDWYDLGMMHGRQIDVTVSPDTTHTLNIGVPTLYIYQGDNDNGTPILQQVASARIERSQGTISYIDQNTTDRHYVFHVPNANTASYGGYTIRFGDAEGIDNTLMQGNVRIMAEGRNTVRKGVPCENPITVSNLSNEKSGKFLLSITASENVNIIGFRLPTRSGRLYLPVQEVTTLDGADCEHTILFYVPALNPWESYTFTMISEGKGDIAYAPRSINTQHPTPAIRLSSTATPSPW